MDRSRRGKSKGRRKRQIWPEYGECAGWRGTGRPNLSGKTKFSGENGDRENFNFPLQMTREQDWQPYRLMTSLLK